LVTQAGRSAISDFGEAPFQIADFRFQIEDPIANCRLPMLVGGCLLKSAICNLKWRFACNHPPVPGVYFLERHT
jgi:hypothetical protein